MGLYRGQGGRMCELVLGESISWSKSGVFSIWFCSSSLEGGEKGLM